MANTLATFSENGKSRKGIILDLWARMESNHRPSDYEAPRVTGTGLPRPKMPGLRPDWYWHQGMISCFHIIR